MAVFTIFVGRLLVKWSRCDIKYLRKLYVLGLISRKPCASAIANIVVMLCEYTLTARALILLLIAHAMCMGDRVIRDNEYLC